MRFSNEFSQSLCSLGAIYKCGLSWHSCPQIALFLQQFIFITTSTTTPTPFQHLVPFHLQHYQHHPQHLQDILKSQTHNSSLSLTAPSYPQHPHLQDFVQHSSSHTNTFISRTTNRTPYLTVTNISKSNSKSIFTHHHHCTTHIPKIYETLCRQTQNQILLLRDGSGYQNG